MKVKVNRSLSRGRYSVGFDVGDFTAEELAKMDSFGVPNIQLKQNYGPTKRTLDVRINQISSVISVSYESEREARDYEAEVLARLRQAISEIRQRQDNFTSSAEVDL